MAEAESAKKEAFQATLKCRKAEIDASEAIRKVKSQLLISASATSFTFSVGYIAKIHLFM